MWRSRVIASRILRSAHSNPVTRFSHSLSKYSLQLHSKVTLVSSYSNSKSFSSHSNYVRLYSSSLLDLITNDVSDTKNTEYVESVNGERQDVDIEQLEKVKSFLKSVNGDFDVVSKLIVSGLNEMNLNLNEEFVMRVLEDRGIIPGGNMVVFYKWAIRCKNQEEFFATTKSLDALFKAFTGMISNSLTKAAFSWWDLVQEIGEKKKGVVTTKMLNSMISYLSLYGGEKYAFEVFDKFGDFSCETNAKTYFEVIGSLCLPCYRDGCGPEVGVVCKRSVGIVCERMISEGKLMEPQEVGFMIHSLCKAGMPKEAHSLYLLAKEKQKCPSPEYVKILFNSLCDRKKIDSDSVHLALNMLDEIYGGDKRKYAIKQFSCVVQALCKVNDLEMAKSLLTKMIDNGPPPGNAVFNTIINYVVKSGDMAEVVKSLRIMEDRGLKPDLFAYSVIVSGYIKRGEMENAVKVFSEAKKNHGKLSPAIYNTIIRGYCRLKKFENAVKLLEEMEEYGVEPDIHKYNNLIMFVCLKAMKADDWDMAVKLMEVPIRKGLCLNKITRALAVEKIKELDEQAKGTKQMSFEAF